MRSTLSPAFTSSKMRTMHALINECAEKFSDYFVKECGKENVLSIEMKDAFTRYTNDVIATTAFGIHCDSLNEKTNDFFLTGKKYTTFSFKTLLKLMGLIYMKPVMKVNISSVTKHLIVRTLAVFRNRNFRAEHERFFQEHR